LKQTDNRLGWFYINEIQELGCYCVTQVLPDLLPVMNIQLTCWCFNLKTQVLYMFVALLQRKISWSKPQVFCLRLHLCWPHLINIATENQPSIEMMFSLKYPLVNIQKAIENGHRNSGFTHSKWWFSIVMWKFTRG